MKYDSVLAEILYTMSLTGGCDEEVALPDGGGWWGALYELTPQEVAIASAEVGIPLPSSDMPRWTRSYLLHEDSDGFVTLEVANAAAEISERLWSHDDLA